MSYAWWAIAGAALAGISWHEVTEHHLLRRLFRRPVTPSPHDRAWASLARPRRREIHAEMTLLAGLASAVTGLYSGAALLLAAVMTATAAASVMFGRRSAAQPPC